MRLKLFVTLTVVLLNNDCLSFDGYRNRVKRNKDEYYDENRYVNELFNKNPKCIFGMCEDAPDYPQGRIMHLLKRTNVEPSFFGIVFNAQDVAIGSRAGFEDPSEKSGYCCKSNSILMYPKMLQDKNKGTKYIVNVEGHQQGIFFDVCAFPSQMSICNINDIPKLLNYEFTCEQKYATVRLMNYLENNTLDYGEFSVPSACVVKTYKMY